MAYNVHFIARIGTDAEIVTTGNTPFISCRVAVEDTNGKERTTRWVSVSADANRYKNIAQYLTKGKLVLITGIERVNAYASKNGELGVDTRVWADKIEFLPSTQKQEANTTPSESNSQEEKNSQMTSGPIKNDKTEPVVVVNNSQFNDDNEELPF